MPFYDTTIEYSKELDKEALDAGATYYFEKVFSSRSVMIETKKHNYTGQGMYLFATDKKMGNTGIYKVFYTINVKIKGKKCHVSMSDFKLENQHSPVSFQYLVSNAKQNDAKSITVLSMFHKNNRKEIEKATASITTQDHGDYATASK